MKYLSRPFDFFQLKKVSITFKQETKERNLNKRIKERLPGFAERYFRDKRNDAKIELPVCL